MADLDLRDSITNIPSPAKGTSEALHVDASPKLVEITLSDATVYDPPLLGIRVGTTAGAVKVVSGGADVTIPAVDVGETIVGQITKVYNTGTAAVGLTGWQR